MAADSKVTIDLELRKEQAERRLREFEKNAAAQLERLQQVQEKYDKTPTGFVRQQLLASQGAYERRLGAVQGAAQEVKGLELKIDQEEARRGGKLFGVAVSKNLERFAKQFVGMYLARETMNIGFAAMYRVGESNANLRHAQEATEGAISGGMIGSAFGPIGIAAGALSGAILGLTSSMVKLQKEVERELVEQSYSWRSQQLSSGRQMQTEAFERMLQYQKRPQRIKELDERLYDLETGRGELSIKSLGEKLTRLTEEDDIESTEFRRTKELLDRARGEQSQLQLQIFREVTKPIYKAVDPSSFTDQYAKQGLYTGRAAPDAKDLPIAGIDFQALNNPVVTELKMIRKVLDDISSKASEQPTGEAAHWLAHHRLSATFGM